MPKPRIGLSVALILVAVLCGWLGMVATEARRQREAIEWVELNGGWVLNADQSHPAWAQNLFGSLFRPPVVRVCLRRGSNNLRDISPLAALPEIEHLELVGHAALSDISPLSRLSKLRELWLRDNAIEDITTLETLQGLEVLDVSKNLIADMSSVESLPNLKTLRIHSNPISPTEYERLRRKYPQFDL